MEEFQLGDTKFKVVQPYASATQKVVNFFNAMEKITLREEAGQIVPKDGQYTWTLSDGTRVQIKFGTTDWDAILRDNDIKE